MEDSQEWFVISVAPRYEMNRVGEVRNIETKVPIKGTVNKGYKSVSLSLGRGLMRKNYLVHRLYAAIFIPNPENKPLAVFMTKDKMKMSVDNIQWMTEKEKIRHMEKILNIDFKAIRKKASEVSNLVRSIPINFINEKGESKFYPSASACARGEGMTLYKVLKSME
jgi:hypothetical protein